MPLGSLMRFSYSKEQSPILSKRYASAHPQPRRKAERNRDNVAHKSSSKFLPDISRSEPKTSVNIVESFKEENNSQLLSEPVAAKLDNAGQNFTSLVEPPAMAFPLTTDDSYDSPVMSRDYSTASSSASDWQDGDFSGQVSRHSSSSSIVDDSDFNSTVNRLAESIVAVKPEQESRRDSESSIPVRRKAMRTRASTDLSMNSSSLSQSSSEKPLPAVPAGATASNKHRKRVQSIDEQLKPRCLDNRSTLNQFPIDASWRAGSGDLSQMSSRNSPCTKIANSSTSSTSNPRPDLSRGRRQDSSISLKTSEKLTPAPLNPNNLEEKKLDSRPILSNSSKSTDSNSVASESAESADSDENAILSILYKVDKPVDLENMSVSSKDFFTTFKRHQNQLTSNLVFRNSRPAWELRRNVLGLKGSQAFTLKDYRDDLSTMRALKSLILMHSGNVCKSKTICGLIGQDTERETEVENALWRIWSYCLLFSDYSERSTPSMTEISWLKGSKGSRNRSLGPGFGIGNGAGLSTSELEDVNEMWLCLQTLVSQFHGRVQEAKRVGILDNRLLKSTLSESQHLAEWTSYLLTLGPQVILALSSGSFEQAKMMGLTKWRAPAPDRTRSTFLIAAVAQVYQEQMLAEATSRAIIAEIPNHIAAQMRNPDNDIQPPSVPQRNPNRVPQLRLDTSMPVNKSKPVRPSAHLQTTKPKALKEQYIVPENTPVTAMQTSGISPLSASEMLSLDATVAQGIEFKSPIISPNFNVSGMDLPIPLATSPIVEKIWIESSYPKELERVIDPIDKAMDYLVKEKGYAPTNAGRALAKSDTGSGVDVDKALALLIAETPKRGAIEMQVVELPTPIDIIAPLPKIPDRKYKVTDYCAGRCKTSSSTKSTTSRRSSLHIASAPASPVRDNVDDSDDDVFNVESKKRSASVHDMTSVSSLSEKQKSILDLRRASSVSKAWKVLGVEPSETEKSRRKSAVVSLEEYQIRITNRRIAKIHQDALRQRPQSAVGMVEGLSRNFKGLGLGLAGLRVVEEEEMKNKTVPVVA